MSVSLPQSQFPRSSDHCPAQCHVDRINFYQGTFANLCRTTFVRVHDLSMIMLFSFFACVTSMFAPVSDSVEVIKFVTFATCHVTTNHSPFSSRYPTCLGLMHSTLPPVALLKSDKLREIVNVIDWAGCQARSRFQQRVLCSVQACNHENFLGRYDHVGEPGFCLPRRLTVNGIREVYRDPLLQRDGACHARCTARWGKAASRLSP